MKFSLKAKPIYTVFWLIILCIYWCSILCINFSKNPDYYCTDMYSDILFATEVWSKGTVFPEGWVFGNQLYVVATPVLAALFCGIAQDPCVAMGIASTLMGLAVIYSFSWMLKPIFTGLHERLAAICFFMTVILLCADPVFQINGWQLFFTMCSYYACYAITIFLAIGCYIRSSKKRTRSFYGAMILTCILSFGTGMQSLRQTAIMAVPLIAVECLKLFHAIITKETYSRKSLQVAALLCVSNFAGVLLSRGIDVNQTQIFGSFSICFPSDFLRTLISRCMNPFTLFSSHYRIAGILFSLICVCSVIYVFYKKTWHDDPFLLCLLIHIVSILGIIAISIFTTMYVREIYFFMLFPLAAIAMTFVYSRFSNAGNLLLILLILITLPVSKQKLDDHLHLPQDDSKFRQVSDYLEQHNIETVYSPWNLGEKIAIASDFRIQAGFWDDPMNAYQSVKYICDPGIFEADPSACAYAVQGKDVFEKAGELATRQGITLDLMQYFPDLDIYLFTSNQRLMK